ncbi:MAG: A/G-specific adenine glycosylase [Eubacteriaceae bacterium]|nr:A/G-specific adenine glycosylase [Eubacteriaceae bacterium]
MAGKQWMGEEWRIKDFQGKILDWFDKNKRSMPWRDDPAPYRVWVSEIMLQQTRVDTVIPYFNRFLERLPSVENLADVEEDELLKLWEGLGYYSRARNLKAAATELINNHGGKLPETASELQKLKGIGEYTAGAIASIAFGEKVAAVDGNVFRVMARLTENRGDLRDNRLKNILKREAERLLPDRRIGDFNQGMIELGALVCISRVSPKCAECPVTEYCLSFNHGTQVMIPYKSKGRDRSIQNKTVLLIRCKDKFAIRKRPGNALLGGLWELPLEEGHLTAEDVQKRLESQGMKIKEILFLKNTKAIFSHLEWRIHGYAVTLWESSLEEAAGDTMKVAETEEATPALVWATGEEIGLKYPMASAYSEYTDELHFFSKKPLIFPVYEAIREKISQLPGVNSKVQKTQITFTAENAFAWVWLPIRKLRDRPENYLILTFGLDHQVVHPRIVQAVEPYPNRWTHHVIIENVTEIDEEIMSWIIQAYHFARGKKSKSRAKGK